MASGEASVESFSLRRQLKLLAEILATPISPTSALMHGMVEFFVTLLFLTAYV